MRMTSPSDMVREFHEKFGCPIGDTRNPQARTPSTPLRLALLEEEYATEYVPAVAAGDLVEIADALADMVYVIYGTALDHGIDLDAVLAEVHRSNMTKQHVGSQPVVGGFRKLGKGPGFSPADIAAVLARAAEVPSA